MATIVNARDVLLQAAIPRTILLTLPGITVDDAVAALAELDNITSDSVLSKDEKPAVVLQYNAILADQSGLDSIATAFGITTEKTTYDNAITALTDYLTALSPAYNSYVTDTTIVRATFNGKFEDVYTARTALFNKISDIAAYGALTGDGVIVTDMIDPNAATEIFQSSSDPLSWGINDPDSTWTSHPVDAVTITVVNPVAEYLICEVVARAYGALSTLTIDTSYTYALRARILQDGTEIDNYQVQVYPGSLSDFNYIYVKKITVPASSSSTLVLRLEGYASTYEADTFLGDLGGASGHFYIGAALIKR